MRNYKKYQRIFGIVLDLQAALLFNSIYATKVWASGEADNEGGTTD